LTETLLSFVLTRLDQIEAPIFLHREVEVFPSEEIGALLSDSILRETSKATEIPRPAHLPAGSDLIVRRTTRGLFGVAGEDGYFDPVPLTEDDVRQYEISISKLADKLRRENGINGTGGENHRGLISLGQKFINGFGTFDVYLSLPNEDEATFLSRCQRLRRSSSEQKVVLLTPRGVSISPEGRQILDLSGVIVDSLMPYALKGSLTLNWVNVAGYSSTGHRDGAGSDLPITMVDTGLSKSYHLKKGESLVEFTKDEDGWHWIVNQQDKGVVAKKDSSIIYKISRILYDQIGCGWTPHKTFYQKIGWTEEEYFGVKDKTGRMQKQLGILRKNFGLKIFFRKDQGVNFSEEVVKSPKTV
jgi:hypothetical protein